MGGGGLLGLLQLVDSSFPSGAYTLSHGLESLVLDGVVRDPDMLVEAIGTQLVSRLARADLPATAASVAGDLDDLRAVDRALLATKLASEERAGSRRVGRRIADEVARLVDDPRLSAYATEVREGRTPGTSAVAFGVAAGALGVPVRDAVTGAASSFVLGQAAVAVRLGLIGHREAQSVIRQSGASVTRAVETALTADPLDPRPSAPAVDIAMARHETAPVRMFAS